MPMKTTRTADLYSLTGRLSIQEGVPLPYNLNTSVGTAYIVLELIHDQLEDISNEMGH